MRPREDVPVFKISRLHGLMIGLASSGPLSVARVSQELGVSCRTFQRRLSEHDLTFRDVLAQVRLEMAQRLLVQTNLPVQDIAVRLGYRKPGAFARAFAHWTGRSPSSYRKSGPK